jgi:Domain of unknown function (DUF222)
VGFTDFEQAQAVLKGVQGGIDAFLGGYFWRLSGEQQLALARPLEVLGRKVFAAQVHLAGEIDLSGVAAAHSCTSTAAMLRQLLNISPGDASARVNLARKILPHTQPTGDLVEPVLPVLGQALEAGEVGGEHARIITATMKNLPPAITPQQREHAEHTLVDQAKLFDPRQFDIIAQRLADALDPGGTSRLRWNGTLDERDPSTKAEFSIGSRNTSTGLTPINGKLDDEGVAVVRKAIGPQLRWEVPPALSAPAPRS